ncbi:MAG: class I SAM-dependent methyltransferase [Chloroflexi bacterium]|nr:class I SAM-dependent methyltransferase [Chloroflexota bacterium]
MTIQPYPGQELEIFAQALNWKAYFAARIRRSLGSKVLEVGAGMGAVTPFLCDGNQDHWLCLEPDPQLAQALAGRIAAGELPPPCRARPGTLADLGGERFDTILYTDVLEHIGDDQAELRRASDSLFRGGRLIVLAPAHQGLFSPFDLAIGHFRRYDRQSLLALTPDGCRVEQALYLDSAGLLLSLANRLLLRQTMPTLEQILFWDRRVIPVSKALDRLTGYRLGKSILAIWKRM